jgi:uncharacterized protein (DUF58 family)
VVLDVSKSMAWAGAPNRLTKLSYAEHLVAAISLLLLRQRDAVGIIRFDSELRTVLPPRARRQQWRRIITTLEEPGAGRESQAPEALMQAGRVIRRPGMVILISDLLMDEDHVGEAVAALRAAGHDVAVFHIVDPAERDLSIAAEAIFEDPESGAHVAVRSSDVREAYQATVTHAFEEWRNRIVSSGASYALVSTDEPFGVPLRQAFAARQRLP